MIDTAGYEEWKQKLFPVLEIKADEFELLGYGKADREEIWKCVVGQVEKKYGDEPVRLHQFVDELMGLSLNDYMNRLRMESLKGPDWFSGDEPLSLDEFDEPSS
ncbi:MAG TPA: post-transcriptional regulator [Bacillales bacterium]|nr:post-transcriptional regulator [Bacillales bacterium]